MEESLKVNESSSAVLRTTEDILEELITGTVPQLLHTDPLFHSPQPRFSSQSESSRNTYDANRYSMYQRQETQPKEFEITRLEVKKWGQGHNPVIFRNVNELSAQITTEQHQGKEVCSSEEDTECKQPCVVCREEKDVKGMNSISSENRQPENLSFILKTLLDIEVTSDVEQPTLICALCFDTLTVFFRFYQKVKIAQYIFKGSMKSQKDTSTAIPNNIISDGVIAEGADESHLEDQSLPMSYVNSDYNSDQEDSLNTPISVKVTHIKLPKLHSEETKSAFPLRIKKAKHILANSPFSHLVNRKISDKKWEHIYAVMTSTDDNGSSLKVLDDIILYQPFAGDWHCIECKKTISGGRTNFIDHSLQSHVWYAEQVMFPCDVCGLVFPLVDSAGIRESYCEHWLQHFFPKQCSVCQMKFVSHFALREHIKVHNEGLFESDTIEEVFLSSSKLKVHKNLRAPPEVKKNKMATVACKICKKNVSDLRQHNRRLHFEDTAWKCEDCDKKFLTRSLLKSHRNRVHPDINRPPSFKCTVCGESFTSQPLRARHLYSVHRTREIKCEVCDKSFHLQHHLKVHMLSHQTTGNCVCEVCGKSVKGEKHLKEHMYIHSGEKPFGCPICAVRIRMKSNLWKHMKSVHKTTLKAYRESTAYNSSAAIQSNDVNVDVSTEQNHSLRCNDCGELFESIEILQVHRKKHFELASDRLQVWKCDYCDKTFDSASAKGKHIEEKHEDKLEGNTTCVLCNKIYPTVLSYSGHMWRAHNRKEPVRAACEICGKVFNSKGSLRVHIRNVHIPTTKSVVCPLCPSKFRREDLLKRHIRKTHKGSRSLVSGLNSAVRTEVIPEEEEESQLKHRSSPMSYHSDQEESLNTPFSTVKRAAIDRNLLSEEINSGISPEIRKAKDILAKSPFSHFVNRKISDEKWVHIYSVMTSADGNGSSLNLLDDCILNQPCAGDWRCLECKNTIIGGRAEFIDHCFQTHVWNPEQVMFPCDVCGFAFPIIDSTGITESYSEHWLKHVFPNDAAMELENVSSTVVCPGTNQSLRCNDCGDVFETNQILGTHRDSLHLTLTRGKTQVLRKCDYCNECFNSAAAKAKHIGKKHPEKLDGSTTCTLCNKIYPTKLSYKNHMNGVHSGKEVQKIPCDICGKIFKSKQILKGHIRNVHNGPTTNSVPCPLCPWKFRRQDLVSNHMRGTHKVTMAEYRKSLASASSDTISATEKK